ncbi:MAG: hypothetical protein OEZ58_01585, partial [Gammaproteobacteria bacterium]|nr:hypothetical protein [Gammaproteobacteria bacterium]
DIVELLNSEDIKNPQIEWLQVKLHDGLNGFVSRSAVRSPRDYQACFLLRKQKWRMISLFSQF